MSRYSNQLERLLLRQGFGSKKELRQLVRQGLVSLDDQIQDDPFVELQSLPKKITVNSLSLPYSEELFLIFNKPANTECTHVSEHYQSIYGLFPYPFINRGLQSAGRLDADCSGLLLLSSSGNFLHTISSPKKKIPKTYRVNLARSLGEKDVKGLLDGVLLRGEKNLIQADCITMISEQQCDISIHQGLYHQVKRMFAAIGNHVEALQRIRIGNLAIPEELSPGFWNYMTEEMFRAVGLPEFIPNTVTHTIPNQLQP